MYDLILIHIESVINKESIWNLYNLDIEKIAYPDNCALLITVPSNLEGYIEKILEKWDFEFVTIFEFIIKKRTTNHPFFNRAFTKKKEFTYTPAHFSIDSNFVVLDEVEIVILARRGSLTHLKKGKSHLINTLEIQYDHSYISTLKDIANKIFPCAKHPFLFTFNKENIRI